MKAICKNANVIDERLCEIDAKLNWLDMVSPTNNLERWEIFKSSNYKKLLPLTYKDPSYDVNAVLSELSEIDFENIQNSAIGALLHEKKEELELFIDLIKFRGREGFLTTSTYLFGGSEPDLLNLAKEILRNVEPQLKSKQLCPVSSFVIFAKAIRKQYQELDSTFDFNINVEEDLNSSMMVSQGDLFVSKDMHITQKRIRALVAHEVEVHIVTYFNGSKQPLKLLKTGLANYDVLQEGLATFCEYLVGNLSPNRLRELGARVIASDLAIKGESVQQIFEHLYEGYKIHDHEAFDTAIRAKRGGGLTKDSVYLQGLRQVHAFIKSGEKIENLFLGKFSLNQRQTLSNLLEEKILIGPSIVPSFLSEADTLERIEFAKTHDLIDLVRRG